MKDDIDQSTLNETDKKCYEDQQNQLTVVNTELDRFLVTEEEKEEARLRNHARRKALREANKYRVPKGVARSQQAQILVNQYLEQLIEYSNKKNFPELNINVKGSIKHHKDMMSLLLTTLAFVRSLRQERDALTEEEQAGHSFEHIVLDNEDLLEEVQQEMQKMGVVVNFEKKKEAN